MKEKRMYVEREGKLLSLFSSHDKPYETTLLGKKWTVLPNVFSPKYAPDAVHFVKWFPNLKGKEFLEIGCGTGIIAVEAALKGAKKVVATDINNNAVENTRINAKRHKVDNVMSVRKGSLFNSIGKDEKFDIIFFNLPFGYRKKPLKNMLEKSVWDYGLKTQIGFLREGKTYLRKKGIMIVGYSTIGHIEEFKKNTRRFGYSLREIYSKKVTDVEGTHTFKIFKLVLK